jgi:hypothetical protein
MAVALGRGVNASCPGALSLGTFNLTHDAGTIVGSLIANTTSSTPKEMYSSLDFGNPTYVGLVDNNTYFFTMQIVGTDNTDYYAAEYDFVISRNSGAGTVAIRGTPVKTVNTQTTGSAAWDINVTADTTGGSTTIYWSGSFIASAVKTA